MSRTTSKFKTLLAELAYRSGAFLLFRAVHRLLFGPGIRILYYHRVAAECEPGGFGQHPLSAREFENHLSHLRRFYHVIRLEEAAEYLAAGRAFPPNSVVITFDDGYRDNLTVALPLLEKHALPAALFVVTSALDGKPLWFDLVESWFRDTTVASLCLSWIESELNLETPADRLRSSNRVRTALKSLPGGQFPRALAELRSKLRITGRDRQPENSAILTWDELRSMSSSGVFTIGAHTVSHRLLPTLDDEEIRSEIEESCSRLSQELHQSARFFAYPGGAYNSTAQFFVRNAGIVACANQGSGFNPSGSDLTALRRLGAEDMRQSQFTLYLAGWEDLRDAFFRKLEQSRRFVKRFAYRMMESFGLFPLLRHLNRRKILVLLYHGVSHLPSTSSLNDLHVPVEQFRRQMHWLRRKFTPISLSEMIAALEGRAPWPQRAVLVSLDDGYRNNLEIAWPILRESGFQPILFAPTAYIGNERVAWTEDLERRIRATRALGVRLDATWLWLRTFEERRAAFREICLALKRISRGARECTLKDLQDQLRAADGASLPAVNELRLTWEELGAFQREGVDVGSHTICHGLLPLLAPDEIRNEVEGSKRELESRLKTSILAFAYPNGDWNDEVRQEIQSAGYSCAFSAQPGMNGPLTDRFLLHRVPINANDSFGEFMGAVSDFNRCGMKPAPKILEISNYPPPECGWARQTKLLTKELARRGAVCEVVNINESRKIKNSEYVDVQNAIDYVLKVLTFALRGYRLHTHVNAESRKGYLLTLAGNLIARAVGRPAVMTFHGGLPQTYFPRNDSQFLEWAYRLLFLSADSIICNSAEIKQAIQSYGTNGQPIVAVPGFSKQYLEFQKRKLPARMEAFLSGHDPTFFCFVCFRSEYALDALLEGMERFALKNARAGFVWLGFPDKELRQVEAYLDSRKGGRPRNLLLLGNLDHDMFLSLLSRCSAYVRPPACDGVAASVLESLALHVPVIASENGRRPPGVVTFRFGDPADICAKLQYVVEHYETVKHLTQLPDVEDNIERTAAWLLARGTGNKNLIDECAFQN
jgi:peptidoglycan/xylan/chitin deacetylase (PgdA/CDA1 family)/glycosyltransferase involved in cell wall biosynthesis